MVIDVTKIKLEDPQEEIEFAEDIQRIPFDELIRKYLGKAFKYAKSKHNLSREDVARILSNRRKKSYTVHMFNKWTRLDGDGLSFPLELLEDIVDITCYKKLMYLLPVKRGYQVLTPSQGYLWSYIMACVREEQARLEREFQEKQMQRVKAI
jgi:hypothetical protein